VASVVSGIMRCRFMPETKEKFVKLINVHNIHKVLWPMVLESKFIDDDIKARLRLGPRNVCAS